MAIATLKPGQGRRAREGEQKGAGAALLRAFALGYYLAPLPRLVGLTSRITGAGEWLKADG